MKSDREESDYEINDGPNRNKKSTQQVDATSSTTSTDFHNSTAPKEFNYRSLREIHNSLKGRFPFQLLKIVSKQDDRMMIKLELILMLFV
jgi:hypothetical protein